MDKDQVIAVMKKNFLSILSGVVALLAIAFMFFWLNGQVADVKQRTQARADKAGEITNLLNESRPDLQVNTAGDQTLPMFPTNRLIAAGRETMEGVKAQAEEVLERAKELNRRVPLGSETFEEAQAKWPLEGEQAAPERQSYKQAYARRINADNAFNADTGDYPEGTIQAEMRATRPPSAEELATQEEGLTARLRSELPVDAQGNPQDPEAFQRRLARGRVELASSMKYRRAEGHLMYVDPNGAPGSLGSGFTVHPLAVAQSPTAVDCFNAQLGLWIQETVAANLLRANEGHENLLSAPVKHLVSVSVPLAPFGEAKDVPAANTTGGEPAPPVDTGAEIRRGGGAATPATPPPAEEETPVEEQPPPEEASTALTVDPTAEIQRQYERSPSGRPLHTPFYDLVQFQVVLRCDAGAVPLVLEQLQANSFLTVLNLSMTRVDPAVAAQVGFVYGDGPVVQLQLLCEMPFLRTWLVDLMPAGLQQAIIAAETAAAQQPQ